MPGHLHPKENTLFYVRASSPEPSVEWRQLEGKTIILEQPCPLPSAPHTLKAALKSPMSSPNTMARMPHWGHFRHLGSFLWLHDVSEKFSVLAISMLFRRKPELPEILNSDIKRNSKLSIDEEVEGNDEITTSQKLWYSSRRKKCSLTLLRSLAGSKN